MAQTNKNTPQTHSCLPGSGGYYKGTHSNHDPQPWGYKSTGSGGSAGGSQKIPLPVVIQALANNDGILKYTAEQLGIHRSTLARYVETYPQVWEGYLEAREEMLDIAEHNFFKLVRQPSHPAHFASLKFFLETVGRGRGYSSKVEYNLKDETRGVSGQLDFNRLTKKELMTFQRLIEKATVSSREVYAEEAMFEEVPNE